MSNQNAGKLWENQSGAYNGNGPSSLESSENEIITDRQIQNEKKQCTQTQFTPGMFSNCYRFILWQLKNLLMRVKEERE